MRYRPKFPSSKKEKADTAIVDLSLEHPELGADKVSRLVRNRGLRLSSERVRQERREECLQVPPPKKKQSRHGTSTGLHSTKAEDRGHVWRWDFIYDSTVNGGSFHDKFRRECLAREHFYTLSEARVVIAAWKKKYKELRPRRSLEMKTPEEFANGCDPGERWRAQQASCVSAYGHHSGSLLKSGLETQSEGSNFLTLRGP